MGFVVEITKVSFTVDAARTGELLSLLKASVASPFFVFFHPSWRERGPHAIPTTTSVTEIFEATPFRVTTDDTGAVIDLSYSGDKLPQDTTFEDMEEFFEGLAPVVTRGSLVVFRSSDGYFRTFRFDGKRCRMTARAVPQKKPGKDPGSRSDALCKQGRYDEALAVLDGALGGAIGNARAPLLWKRVALLKGARRTAEVVAAYDTLTDALGDADWVTRTFAFRDAGEYFEQHGDDARAERCFAGASSWDQARFLARRRRWDRALEVGLVALAAPDAGDTLFERSRGWIISVLHALGRHAEVVDRLPWSLVCEHSSDVPHDLVNDALLWLARYDEAIAGWNATIARWRASGARLAGPRVAGAQVDRCRVLEARGERPDEGVYARAIAVLDEGIEAEDVKWAVFAEVLAKGRALLGLGRAEEALATVASARASPIEASFFPDKQYFDQHLLRGEALVALGRGAESLAAAGAALDINTHRPEPWILRARALLLEEERDEARAAIARVEATPHVRQFLARDPQLRALAG